jgi:uncharacterized membrane protein YcaP (DUF421 family)
MFDMSMSAGEHVIRAAVVYAFLFVLIRWIGKKHAGELSPFDLVVLLILSETVQNSMVGDDNSLVGGLISAGTLVALAQAVNYLCWRYKRASRLLEGTPKVLVRHGRCLQEAMRSERVTVSELTVAMRAEGCANIADIRYAILENDGNISIIRRDEA